ncbi:ESCO2 acetyltransferase, partial [Onychorhynchus coronatus]|nr:ESCO2 acetyltransferase [Onychorhynchus coronatus]
RPHVPVGSFYGKGKNYLDPVERRKLQEIQVLGMRSGHGNVPATSGNWSRNPNPKAAKHAPNPKRGQSVPKTKKSKAEIPAGKPSVEKEAGNCLVQKKMDSPFRVLSMKVKPALKLQLGAAFFTARKKSHSKKNPGDSKAPQALPKSLQENDEKPARNPEPAGGSETPEERGVLGRIPVPQENRESSGNPGDSGHGGKAPPQKTGSVSCASTFALPEMLWNHNHQPCPGLTLLPLFSMVSRSLDEIPAAFGSSPPGKVPHTSQKSRKAKELCKRSRDQMIIDAGQKHFGAIMCKSCGMIYSAASPEDEAQHIQHHERFLEALRYVGWKKERVVAEFWDGKIVLILPTDPKYAVKKAEEVREIVDEELGFQQVSLRCPAQSRTYLFVSGGMIVGCLLAEPIKQAFRVLSEPCPGDHSQPSQAAARAWRCSADPEPAVCGVSRVWVLAARRRTGIARRMLHVLRSTFMYGSVLSSREIAFSDPTPHGKLLATSYCQTPNFLVYNFLSK